MSDLDMSAVVYRPIPGFPGYRVGSDGSVWSCLNNHGRLTGIWHRMGVHRRPGQRYGTVCLRHRSHYVHRVVLEAFVGPCPPGMVACHNNGDLSDNRPENLQWGTKAENEADKVRHGTRLLGSQVSSARLTEKDAVVIRRLHERGTPAGVIAEAFGVHPATVRTIVRGASWKHVGERQVAGAAGAAGADTDEDVPF